MGLNNLVGGRGFTLGKFTSNLNASTQSGALKNFRDPIRRVVEKNLSAIQGGRFKSAEAMRHLQRDEKLDYKAKRDVGRIFKQLEATPKAVEEKISRREVLDRALKANDNGAKSDAKDRPVKVPLQLRINRADSEFNEDKVKENRVSALQNRLNEASGVSGPMGKPLPPAPIKQEPASSRPGEKGATLTEHHEHISFN
ncbi:MAG: hypothetical protein WCN88_00670 [Candidatus Falkowbacteria bacterium]